MVPTLLCVVGGGCGNPDLGSQSLEGASPPYIVLVCLDTLRADRLSIMGYHRQTDPVLRELARTAVVFDNVGAQATQTLLSHKSLFTGRYPLSLLAQATGSDMGALCRVEHATEFLVETFRGLQSPSLVTGISARGYRTAAFVDGGWMAREFGFDQGFDVYNDAAGGLRRTLPRTLRWIRRHRDEPFFVFLHSYDVHCPYACREPFDSMFCATHPQHVDLAGRCGKTHFRVDELSPVDLQAVNDHYDGGVASADAFVGELVRQLKELGVYDRTLLIITSDHGESLGEHDQIGHGSFHVDQLAIPLIVKFPKAMQIPGQRIDTAVALLDVLPTVYEVCGIPIPEGLDGRSFLASVTRGVAHRDHLVAQVTFREIPDLVSHPTRRALLVPGRWLVVEDLRQRSVQLFDLGTDPLGLTEVAPQDVPEVHQLVAMLRSYDPGGADGQLPAKQLPPGLATRQETQEQLKALGYLE